MPFTSPVPTSFGFSVQAPTAVGPDKARHCDVLVIGFGAAGAAAAIAARESGAEVVVTDRFGGGGASAMSGGVVYAGGGTKQQKKLGFEDTPEAMYRYLKLEVGDAVSETTLRRFCDDSRGLIEWLEGMGANFDSDAIPPKTSYPNDGVYLYFSGSESAPAFAAQAKPAPRGHRAQGTWMSGKNLFEHLRQRAEALGVQVLPHSPVHRLLTDGAARVVGAEFLCLSHDKELQQRYAKLIRRAERLHNFLPRRADKLREQAHALLNQHGQPRQIHARRGVIISAGGFVFNRAMLLDQAPRYAGVLRLGSTGCDGAGIRLGQSVGAATDRLDKVSAWRFINPPESLPRGIVVGPAGTRFCNEQVYGARLGVEMCESQQGRAWLILDRKLRRQAIREALFGNNWPFQKYPALMLMLFAKRAKTLTQLAAKIDVPAEALVASVRQYNDAAQGKRDDAFGKSAELVSALDQAPFFALDISVRNRLFPCPAITLGGLSVNEETGNVLGQSGEPIAGLFAAGRCAVGIASNQYVSGLSLADCLWSGRRAGHSAAGSQGDEQTTSKPNLDQAAA